MAKRRKRSDILEQHSQSRYFRESKTHLIREVYPNVERIVINLSFQDFDEKCNPSPKQLVFTPESKAFFEIECPFWECVLGGFAFSLHVRQCIESKTNSISGESKCSGWQDQERINKNRCLLKANFTISVSYANSV